MVPHLKKRGFTLVELMIVVVIIGVLASIAIPGFKHYRDKALFAESYTMLGALTRGAKAYYQQEHWARGVITTIGLVGARGNCSVDYAWTTNQWNVRKKTTMNWKNEHASFAALGFNPPDPIYFKYAAAPGNLGQSTCGIAPETLYVFLLRAYGDFNPDDPNAGRQGQFWWLCSNKHNDLFVCSRNDSPTIDYHDQ